MKYFITGFHCSGKERLLKDLKSAGINVGTSFNTISEYVPEIYTCNSVTYTNQDVSDIFENSDYIFLREITAYGVPFYDGLTRTSFDNSDVFCVTPDQTVWIPNVPEDVCFIWLDNTTSERRLRYTEEKRKYDFSVTEALEKEYAEEFINKIYNMPKTHLIYFNNEDPVRVSAVIQALILHPDLLPIFEKRYN